MKEKMRTIGYLCPRCRKPVMQQRSRFALAASGAIVQCECGKSELQIDFDGEKFRISVPCGAGRNGLPIGMQLIGDCFQEKKLFRAAYAYECTRNYERCPLAQKGAGKDE